MARVADYGDFSEREQLDGEKLSSLSQLVRDLEEADRKAAEVEVALKEAQERARHLREFRIPELMQEVGLESVKTADGATVTVRSKIRASIPADQKDAAFDWLDEQGFGGMVKREVRVPFPKGQEAEAMRFLEQAKTEFPDAREDRSVHPMTLSAWAKRRMGEGKPLPAGLFGIFEQREAVVKR